MSTNVTLGQSASLSKTISEEDLRKFAEVSLDYNPVHFDEAYAKSTRFGGRIAHGMLGAGLISAVLGTKLPGPGTVYLSQSIKFLAPVRLGETITATVTVSALRHDKPIATLETVVRTSDDVEVIRGEAVVLLP